MRGASLKMLLLRRLHVSVRQTHVWRESKYANVPFDKLGNKQVLR